MCCTQPRACAALQAIALLLVLSCHSDDESVIVAPAVTSDQLVAALGELSEHVSAHSIVSTSGGQGVEQVSGMTTAAANAAEGKVTLSTGHAADGGLGSMDLLGDGRADVTTFQFTVDVPSAAASLRLDARFVTGELVAPGVMRSDDSARVEVSLDGGPFSEAFVASAGGSFARVNARVPVVVDLAGANTASVRVRVLDAGDGSVDSALVVSNAYFSTLPAPLEPAPPQDEIDIGDEIDRDVVFGDPIVLTTGAYTMTEPLLGAGGVPLPFSLAATYDSREASGDHSWLNSPLGRGWTHSYAWSITLSPDWTHAFVRKGTGGKVAFVRENGEWEPEQSSVHSLLVQGETDIVYETMAHVRYRFELGPGREPLRDIQDAYGNTVTLHYDEEGVLGDGDPETLDLVRDTRGAEAHFEYSEQRLDRVQYGDLAGGASTVDVSFMRDEETGYALLQGITRADDSALTFRYEDNNSSKCILTEVLEPNGSRRILNTYAEDRVISQLDALDMTGTVAYPSMDDDATVTVDRLGFEQKRVFSETQDLTEWVNQLGFVWAFTYDEDHNETSETDPLGGETQLQYDDRGRVVRVTDALDHVVEWVYDGDDLVAEVDAQGQRIEYEYNSQHGVIRERHSHGVEVEYEYDSTGKTTRFIDARGQATTYEYDPRGQLRSITAPTGEHTFYVHDALGRRVSVSDSENIPERATRFEFDEVGRTVAIRDPLGATEFEFDALGHPSLQRRVNDPADPTDDVVTTTAFDALGRQVELVDPAGTSYRSYHDGEGRVTATTVEVPGGAGGHEALRENRFEYDAAGRLVRAVAAPGSSEESSATATYNANGNRLSVTGPGGGTTRFNYDALGQCVSEVDPLGNDVRNGYDARGSLVTITNRRGQRTTFTRDGLGRVTTISDGNDSINHTYDPTGNRIATFGPGGATTQTGYDASGRPIARTDQHDQRVAYQYDAFGNLARLGYPNGESVQYAYDHAGRLVGVTDWAGRRTVYEYGPHRSEPSLIVRPDGSHVSFEYDDHNRVIEIHDIQATGATIFRGVYGYDRAGQRISANIDRVPVELQRTSRIDRFNHNVADQLVSVNALAITYDADGNITSAPLAGVRRDLEFDTQNRLRRIGADELTYDAEGVRVESTLGGMTTRYVYDASAGTPRLLEERDESGTVRARYVHGIGLTYREDANGGLQVYHYDSRGSTIALTDATGAISDTYAYDPWGKILGHEGSTVDNAFRFHGRHGVMDDGNGLLFMRSRYYAPELMRFVQRDPRRGGSLMSPISLHPYAFVNCDPILGVDPNGEFGFFGAVAGAVANVTIKAIIDIVEDGELDESWQSYAGAAVEGAIIGATGGAGVGLGTVVAGAAIGDFTEQVLEGKTSPATYDFTQTLVKAGTAAAFNAAGGKLLKSKANKLLRRGKASTPTSKFQDLQASLARQAAGRASSKSFPMTFRHLAPSVNLGKPFGGSIPNEFLKTQVHHTFGY